MKQKFLLVSLVLLGILVGCKNNGGGGGGGEVTPGKEEALQKAVTPYVNNTVVSTYSAMADAGIALVEQCEQIVEKVEAGQDYSALIAEADASWRLMRKHWEQSEAFLYGPAGDHNIDPHIDSWPLDFNQMNSLLSDPVRMKQIEEDGGAYVGSVLGYALKGFHAAEYLLFESVIKDGRAVGTGKPHTANLTHAEAIYLLGIVEDLEQQAILLEYCWAGEVSDAKAKILEDAEIEPYEDEFGWQMINAGKAGSRFKTYQDVAEEIVAGAIDIAGEVADLKLGNPYISSTAEERDYIESPYSCTSTTDFADNIISIKNAYCGAKAGDASVSDYVKQQNEDLDNRVRKAIDESITAIQAIVDFENTAKGNPQVKAAIDKVSGLEDILDKDVLPLLSK